MAEHQPLRLILASASRGRRQLLEEAGYRFEVMPSSVDEPTGAGINDIRGFVQHVAWLKAVAVAQRIDQGIILAADSVGWIANQVIAKPADRADARRILRLLSGTGGKKGVASHSPERSEGCFAQKAPDPFFSAEHELWTGVILWRRPDNVQLAWQESSRVAFRTLSDEQIETYLDTRLWEGCSGAYAVQGRDDPYVRVVEGTVSNVVGLPMETLGMLLPHFAGLALQKS